jgi:hypothetical protein
LELAQKQCETETLTLEKNELKKLIQNLKEQNIINQKKVEVDEEDEFAEPNFIAQPLQSQLQDLLIRETHLKNDKMKAEKQLESFNLKYKQQVDSFNELESEFNQLLEENTQLQTQFDKEKKQFSSEIQVLRKTVAEIEQEKKQLLDVNDRNISKSVLNFISNLKDKPMEQSLLFHYVLYDLELRQAKELIENLSLTLNQESKNFNNSLFLQK